MTKMTRNMMAAAGSLAGLTIAALPATADQVLEATTLQGVSATVGPGQAATEVPLQLRDERGCNWLIAARLHPSGQRLVERVEQKVCDGLVYQVKGYLVGEDNRAGLPAECDDLWRNRTGSVMCLSGHVPAGAPVRLVVTE